MKYIVSDSSSEAFYVNKNLTEVSNDMDDAVLFTEEEAKEIESSMDITDDFPQYILIPIGVEIEEFIVSIITELESWLDIPYGGLENLIEYIQTNYKQLIEDEVNHHNIYGQLIRSIVEDIELDDF